MQTGDIHLIKDINARLVLNLIRDHQIISAAELAKITGMRPSTISNILKELKAKNLIVNLGKGQSTERGGKRPFLWGLNGEAAFAIGVDVELGELNIAILNLSGDKVYQKVHPLQEKPSLEELIPQIRRAVKSGLRKVGVTEDDVLGLGLAITGVVNTHEGVVVKSDVFSQGNVALKAALQKVFDFPLVVENNANAAAVGARWVGAAKNATNFITVLVEWNRNVGAMGIGLVLGGELYLGANYCAGEINVTLPQLQEVLESLQNRFNEGNVLSKFSGSLAEMDIFKVLDAARKGDKMARLAFERVARQVGRNIAPAIGLINPEKLVIAGDISELEDVVIQPIKEEIEALTLDLVNKDLTITTSQYGRYSVAIGAASIILSEFFKVVLIRKSEIVSL